MDSRPKGEILGFIGLSEGWGRPRADGARCPHGELDTALEAFGMHCHRDLERPPTHRPCKRMPSNHAEEDVAATGVGMGQRSALLSSERAVQRSRQKIATESMLPKALTSTLVVKTPVTAAAREAARPLSVLATSPVRAPPPKRPTH